MASDQVNRIVQEDEIDLLPLVKTIWLKWKVIVRITTLFFIVGLFIAILSPIEYTANSIFVPQISETNRSSGSLGGLASLAGINLSSIGGGSEISPSLYPKIVSSVNFKLKVLNAPIFVEDKQQIMSYKEFYETAYDPGIFNIVKKYTVGLFGTLKNLYGSNEQEIRHDNDQLIKISQEDFQHFKRLENQIIVSPNEKEGFVSLSFILPEPIMAAQMAKFAQDLLQQQVIEYKISNAQEQLKFTQELFNEKKKDFEDIQAKLANFRDRNQNLASASILNQQQRLEAEYNFAFNIYTELAKQLEQAKIQVAKDTPVFSIIQPVTVPVEKSAPRRILILIIFSIFGIIFSIILILIKEFYKGIQFNWNTY